MVTDSTTAVREALIQLAVDMRIEEIQAHGGVDDEMFAAILAYQQDIAEHGDDLIYASAKKGMSAQRFQQVVECVAVLAFVPGGITLFGKHWEA